MINHCGAKLVSRGELAEYRAPEATRTWFPVSHKDVVEQVENRLEGTGLRFTRSQFSLTAGGARMFATYDLASEICEGVTLAIGVRNSIDKSFPLGFVGGSRVFVCDNLAFSGQVFVTKKHTKNGRENYIREISAAVNSLEQYRQAEKVRHDRLSSIELQSALADSIILQSAIDGRVPLRSLDDIVKEWRNPTFEAFQPRTAWSLLNAFTTVLGRDAGNRNPGRYADLTMALQADIFSRLGVEQPKALAV